VAKRARFSAAKGICGAGQRGTDERGVGDVEVWVGRIGNTSIRLEFDILLPDGEMAMKPTWC